MNSIVLYHFPRSSCSRKVALVLKLKGLPHQEVTIDLRSGAHKLPEFLVLNPRGQVPVLRYGASVLVDSAVINEFLEDLQPTPGLLPTDAVARAQCRFLTLVADRDFYGEVSAILAQIRLGPSSADQTAVQRSLAAIARDHLPLLERTLGDSRSYLCGPRITLADIAFFPALDNLIRLAAPDLTPLPRTQVWLDRMRELEASDRGSLLCQAEAA